jgi:hypothetical protein
MFIIASDVVINIDNMEAVYVRDGNLCCETGHGVYELKDIPDNALQQVAEALAEGKKYLELEDAKHVRG